MRRARSKSKKITSRQYVDIILYHSNHFRFRQSRINGRKVEGGKAEELLKIEVLILDGPASSSSILNNE